MAVQQLPITSIQQIMVVRTPLFNPAITSTSATITKQSTSGTPALVNGTEYTIKIKAVNAVGDGDESSAVTATPNVPPNAPPTFKRLAGNAQVALTWTAPSNNGGAAITNYKYSTNNGSSYTSVPPALW